MAPKELPTRTHQSSLPNTLALRRLPEKREAAFPTTGWDKTYGQKASWLVENWVPFFISPSLCSCFKMGELVSGWKRKMQLAPGLEEAGVAAQRVGLNFPGLADHPPQNDLKTWVSAWANSVFGQRKMCNCRSTDTHTYHRSSFIMTFKDELVYSCHDFKHFVQHIHICLPMWWILRWKLLTYSVYLVNRLREIWNFS